MKIKQQATVNVAFALLLSLSFFYLNNKEKGLPLDYSSTLETEFGQEAEVFGRDFKYVLVYRYDVTLDVEIESNASPNYTRLFAFSFDSNKALVTWQDVKDKIPSKITRRLEKISKSYKIEDYQVYQSDRFYKKVPIKEETDEEDKPSEAG